MKITVPPYIDEKKPTVLRTTDQRLLAEIHNTLEQIVKLLSPKQVQKSSIKEKK